MKLEDFPLERLDTLPGIISRRNDRFDIAIGLRPFELDGGTVSTAFRLDGIELPAEGQLSWQRGIFEFPTNPEPGYVDGSLYLRHSHNPIDLTRIEFGEFRDNRINAKLTLSILFEYEHTGFSNLDVEFEVTLEMTAS